MSICSINNIEEIIINLSAMSDELTSVEEVNAFLYENYGYTLGQLLNALDDENLSSLREVLDNEYSAINYNSLLNENFREISTRNNVVSVFRSPEVTPLFHTMKVAENYFEQTTNEKMVIATMIGTGDKYVSTDEEFNNNIKDLKNQLFNTIRSFLGLPKVNIYDEFGNFIPESYEDYVMTINKMEEYFGDKLQITSYSGNKVPLLRLNIRNADSRNILDAYNAAIFLTNFDNIIEKYFSSIIKINNINESFNNFQSPPDSFKYELKVKGLETVYWINDDHISESVEKSETKLAKLLISSIKQLNKDGEFTGQYLETKDFYSFASLLQDFELTNYNYLKNNFPEWTPFNENPDEALDWYLNKIEEYHENRLANKENVNLNLFGKSFSYKLEFVKSLKGFFNEHNIAEKEKTSDGSLKVLFTQVINNSVGATYLIYNANKKTFEEKQMHKHKANEIALQNSIYSHISKHITVFDNNTDKDTLSEIINLLPDIIISPDKLELNSAQLLKLKGFIKYKTGLTLTIDNLEKLLFELSSSNAGTLSKEVLNSYLESLYTSINASTADVAANDEKVKGSFADADSQSSVISVVINTPIVREIINRYMDSYMMKPLMNIDTLSGEKIPVFKTMTMTYNDVSLMRSHEKQFKDKKYKNLFTQGTDPVLIGTGTKLEVIKDDVNRSAFKFGIAESFTGNMVYDFYKSIGEAQKKFSESGTPGGYSVLIGNYSDKNTVLTKIINYMAKFRDSEKPIIKEDNESIMEHVRTQSASYYGDLLNNVFDQYNWLFELIGRGEKLDLDFRSNTKTFNSNIDIISKYLLEGTLTKDLKKAFEKEASLGMTGRLSFIEEIHYSSYMVGDKKVEGLNQLTIDYYRIFNSSELFENFAKKQEKSLVEKYLKNFNNDPIIDFQENTKEGMKQYAEYVGIDHDEYVKSFPKNSITDDAGNLNPFVKKWLWTNALFRNEYLYMSGKGEYMHPHKVKDLQYRTGKVTKNKDGKLNYKSLYDGKSKVSFDDMYSELSLEMSGRLSSMAKRNVAFTATIELPARKTRHGVPELINLAVIEDYNDQVYNIDGKTHDQDIHDGSSIINYVYNKMINASYPGKGYRNTKKQFGTLITPFGAIVKKDAETVITNSAIRASHNSRIKLKNKQKQMFGQFDISDIEIPNIDVSVKDKYLLHNGNRFRLNSYSITKGKIKLIGTYVDNDNRFIEDAAIEHSAKSLYDIWEAFGGEYSQDEKGNFSEGSNDLLYELVTSYQDENDDYILKNKMVHVISNKSAIKSGSTNLNSGETWTSDGTLMYHSFEHRHMGPQLDASHDADGSEVKEITQVISALAQNLSTSDLADSVYKDLAKIIKDAAAPYTNILFKDAKQDQENIFEYVSKKFFDSVVNSQNVSLAKTILESFPPGIQIPFSNQNFFNLFVKDVITRMNNELITRYYSGIAAILNPSHGIIELYEDEEGNTYSQNDIMQDAFKDRDPYLKDTEGKYILDENLKPIRLEESNDDIVKKYIDSRFADKTILAEQFNPGDSYVDEQGTINKLDTIEKYYEFKKAYANRYVLKSYKTTRDLKPSEITFTVSSGNLSNKDQIIYGHPAIGKTHLYKTDSSILDFDSVYKPVLKQHLAKKLGKTVSKLTSEELNNFKKTPEYFDLFKKQWEYAKEEAKEKGLRLFASDLLLLEHFSDDFDKFIDIPRGTFINRSIQRNEFNDFTTTWKDTIDNLLINVDQSKIIMTDLYLSDFLRRPTNLFDTEPVRLKYEYGKFISGKNVSDYDKLVLSEFAKFFEIDIKNKGLMNKYLSAWNQRNLELLDNGRIMNPTSSFIIIENEQISGINFKALFNSDTLIADTFKDVVSSYNESNTEIISDYKFKAAELILPNINKSTFDTGNKSISEIRKIGPSFFKEQYIKQLSDNDSDNDIKILLGEEDPVYIRFVEHLPAQTTELTIRKDFEEVELETEEGKVKNFIPIYTRVDRNGNKLYTCPKDSVINLEGGKEVVYIKAFESKVYEAEDKKVTYYTQISDSTNQRLTDLIKSFGGNIKMIVPLMNNSKVTGKFVPPEEENLEIKKKLGKNYVPIKKTNINNMISHAFSQFTGYVNKNAVGYADKNWLSNNIDDIVNQLANKTYSSWEKSNEFVAARIPSQSLQSFMEMKNVAYFDTEANDAYVSLWQIWLQGSDFDIDKAYIIGYGFDKHAQFELTSNAFNYSSKEQLDILEKFPIPSGIKVNDSKDGILIDEEFDLFYNYYLTNGSNAEIGIYSPEVLKALISILNKANGNNGNIKITKTYNNLSIYSKLLDLLNKHNSSKQASKRRHAMKNSVVSKIKQIVSSPSNQILANTPVDVKELHDAVGEVKSEKNAESLLSSWDMFSMFKQQRDAAVGKDDVGIAANGLKVFFALSNYYNNIYKDDTLSGDYLRTSNHLFSKDLYIPFKEYNPETKKEEWIWKNTNVSSISDTNLSRKQIQAIKDATGKDILVYKSRAALALSAFTSAATDNAKELLMAKLNANVELASMHLYMLSLGMSSAQVAVFMNSRIAKEVVKRLESNMFVSNESNLVSSILSGLYKDESIAKNHKDELNTFKDIYEGAQEFKILAKIFKVNQKTSANVVELHNFLSTFNSTVYARENSLFGNDLKHLKYWNDWDGKTKEEIDTIKNDVAKTIIKNNALLIDDDVDKIIDILDEVSNIKYGDKNVSVIGGNFDFRIYFDQKDGGAYRDAVTKYYNLIKNTINIFDVVDKVPHFKAMIGGLAISHNILLKSSKKYNFVFNETTDIIRNHASKIQKMNENMKNVLGNRHLPVKFGEKEIRRAMLVYDKFLAAKWATSELEESTKLNYRTVRKPSMISLKVSDLLKIAGIDKVILYTDEAKNNSEYDEMGKLNPGYLEVNQNSDMIVDLATDSGIANFKKLMEEVIFEILKKSEYKNEFIDSLRLQSLKNPYGLMTTQIVSSFNLSQLNNPINVEKFQNLLADFNSLDSSVKLLENSKGEKLYWRDLFYTYNLFTNNESYGDKRLTPLFEDYVKERDSIGYDYLLFSSKVDSGQIDIFELPSDFIKNDSKFKITAKKAQINDILFYLFSNKGSLIVNSEINPADQRWLRLENPDFVVTTSMIEMSKSLDKLKNINRVLQWINSNALVVTFKCD